MTSPARAGSLTGKRQIHPEVVRMIRQLYAAHTSEVSLVERLGTSSCSLRNALSGGFFLGKNAEALEGKVRAVVKENETPVGLPPTGVDPTECESRRVGG